MDETFLTFHRVLSFAGISIFAKRNWNSKRWLLFQIFNFFLGFLTFVFTSGFVVSHINDLLLFIQGTCIWTTGVIMFISLGVCLIFRSEFHMFLSEIAFRDGMLEMPLIEHVLKSCRRRKAHELKTLVVESQDKLFYLTRILLKTYVACVWLCATLYLCSPFYQMLSAKDKSLRLLAFDMWFPWSLENLYVYFASFLFHAYAGYLCCIAYPGLQATIILLVGQTIRQLRVLTFILQHLDELSEELVGEREEKWQACCTEILSQCVEHYVKIKRFTNRLNVICQPFYLALILVAIILVCMCSVKIAISNKLSPDTMKYYVHEICFILVVLMFCLLGHQVKNECEKLELAVTEKWYLYDRKHKTSVLIFKLAISQGMPIYIFGSTTLSLPTFTWILYNQLNRMHLSLAMLMTLRMSMVAVIVFYQFIKNGMSFFTLVMSVLED